MNIIDLILIGLSVVEGIGLGFVAHYAEEYKDYRWKALYVVPCIIMFVIMGVGGFEPYMIGLYVGCLLPLVGIYREEKRTRIVASASMVVLAVASWLICSNVSAYRCPDYVADLERVLTEMRSHYCLTEYKEIDFDALEEKYMPLAKEATQQHDRVKGMMMFREFANEFYDAHVNYILYNQSEKWVEKMLEEAYGNDYGLSLMRLDDGRFVAVNVEKDLGIKEGTEVVLWNGQKPESYFDQIPFYYDMNMPDEENAAFYLPLYVAGIGEDEAKVTIIESDGKEKECTLMKRGHYVKRLEKTLDIVDQGRNIGHLEFDKLDEDTVLLRLKQMAYDADTYESTDYSELEGKVKRALASYQEEGVKNIILDLRCNSGGSPHMVMTIAKLFDTEEEHFYCAGGKPDLATGNFVYDEQKGQYEIQDTFTYYGQHLWQGKIIVLVNGRCVSAGDHLAFLFSQMEQATVMGITKTNGSGQGTKSVEFESGMMSYSAIPAMNEDGSFMMDSGPDRKSQSRVDEKIPCSEEAVTSWFVTGEDYVLEYARDWISRN